MPPILLQVNFSHFSHLQDSDDLYATWRVCTKVKETLQHGSRLENLSWRLFFRSRNTQACALPLETTRVLQTETQLKKRLSVVDSLESSQNSDSSTLSAYSPLSTQSFGTPRSHSTHASVKSGDGWINTQPDSPLPWEQNMLASTDAFNQLLSTMSVSVSESCSDFPSLSWPAKGEDSAWTQEDRGVTSVPGLEFAHASFSASACPLTPLSVPKPLFEPVSSLPPTLLPHISTSHMDMSGFGGIPLWCVQPSMVDQNVYPPTAFSHSTMSHSKMQKQILPSPVSAVSALPGLHDPLSASVSVAIKPLKKPLRSKPRARAKSKPKEIKKLVDKVEEKPKEIETSVDLEEDMPSPEAPLRPEIPQPLPPADKSATHDPEKEIKEAPVSCLSIPKALKGLTDPLQASCHNCGTRSTPFWRRSEENLLLCNACGL